MEIIDVLLKIGKYVVELANPVARVGAFITAVTAIYAAVTGVIDKLVIAIDSLVVLSSGGVADFRPLAFVNFVFPFTEFLALLFGWLALYVTAATIRIIKSFVPTVA